MVEKDTSSNYVVYIEGVGTSSRVYRGFNRYDNGWFQLVGYDRDAWIVPAQDAEALRRFDTPEFDLDPEVYPSSELPKDQSERRKAVLQREQYICQNCGESLPKEEKYNGVVRHGIQPKKGGTERLTNLQVYCNQCHGRDHQL